MFEELEVLGLRRIGRLFDCTVPFELKDRFRLAPFLELDPEKWLYG